MIFARRSIQRFLDKLSETLPRTSVQNITDNLNRNDEASLDFEWEAAMLFALGELGTIEYEVSYGGTRSADVTFRLPDKDEICFVADITTVSDRGLEKDNPIEDLLDFLHKKANSLGLPGGFQYRVEGEQTGKQFGNRKARLSMPRKAELRRYLEQNVTPQLREIQKKELDVAEIPIAGPYKISITYRKSAFGSSGSYLSYKAAYSLTRNPISRRLGKKKKQLSESKFEGCMGIFLCDGSCDLLRTRPNAGSAAYSKHEVIRDFLRQNTSIAFVATIWVERPFRGVFDPPGSHCHLHLELFQNPAARVQLREEVARSLKRIPDVLPIPIATAPSKARASAANQTSIANSHYGRSQVKYEVGSTVVRISSRALLRLLAGETPPHQFSEDHWPSWIGPSDNSNNPFEQAFERGMMIEEVCVERNEDEDDDWITLTLSPGDPATGRLYIP